MSSTLESVHDCPNCHKWMVLMECGIVRDVYPRQTSLQWVCACGHIIPTITYTIEKVKTWKQRWDKVNGVKSESEKQQPVCLPAGLVDLFTDDRALDAGLNVHYVLRL